METDNAFQQSPISEAAARFLQSVVVLDDQVVCGSSPGAADTSQASAKLKDPTKKTAAKVDNQIPETKEASGANGNGQHTFELFEVVHSFAAKGVVCGALNPLAKNGNDRAKAFHGVLKAGKSADIVILDWQIDKDNGEKAMELIEELLRADNEVRAARRRLVVIYTGDDEETVKQAFDKRFRKEFEERENNLYRQKEGFRVAFLSKRSVGFSDLPEKAIEEFARMNAGLLSGAVLNGIAAIRENTHRILSRFSPELDGAYLAHRAMTTPPQEAETHIGPLLASELEDVLSGSGLEESLSLEAVKRRLEERDTGNARSIDKVLSEGTEKTLPEGISKNQLKSSPHKLTEWIFGGSFDDAKRTDEQFAALTTLRFPSTTEHKMTLGTVVCQGEGDFYWLCITPACDCVRLTGEQHKLFFLRCRPTDNGGKVHFLIPPEKNDAEYIPITVGFGIEDGHHWEFMPDSDKKMVLAEQDEEENSFRFLSTEQVKLHGLAELKPAHAQRIVHRFSSRWSRVGVTEAEWLRRRSDL